ncbi:hypothetical protein [Henriciella litoralis]|uniref:hypothetical protein n=1 Tax=Henriciella litoralis TaxID=568102 RepID=UPI000A023D94|nr:hypothetical protein [Henriciella litoralis]
MPKNLSVLLTLSAIVLALASCKSGTVTDCADIDLTAESTGYCETTGIVRRDFDRAFTLLQMPDGTMAGINLAMFPDIKDGDRIEIYANYYVLEGGHLSLVRHEKILKLEDG